MGDEEGAVFFEALYSTVALPETNTPAFSEKERLRLIKRHANGWLELETVRGDIGFVSPAWVTQITEVCAGFPLMSTIFDDNVKNKLP